MHLIFFALKIVVWHNWQTNVSELQNWCADTINFMKTFGLIVQGLCSQKIHKIIQLKMIEYHLRMKYVTKLIFLLLRHFQIKLLMWLWHETGAVLNSLLCKFFLLLFVIFKVHPFYHCTVFMVFNSLDFKSKNVLKQTEVHCIFHNFFVHNYFWKRGKYFYKIKIQFDTILRYFYQKYILAS